MKRPSIALLAGCCLGLLLAAIPLWLQHRRWLQISGAGPGQLSGEHAHRSSNSRPVGAEWVETVEGFTADQCRDAASAALATGDKRRLSVLLARWAGLEGEQAVTWLAQHGDFRPVVTGDDNAPDLMWSDLLWDAAAAWSAADPAGIASWLERRGEFYDTDSGDAKFSAWLLWRGLLQFDLRAAIRIAGQFGPDIANERGSELRSAIRTAADAEAAGAEILSHPEWLEKPAPGKSLYLLVALRERWQEIDPDGWDRWAAAHPAAAAKSGHQPAPPGNRFLRSPDRPAAATRILDSAPPGKLAETSEAVMNLWVDEDMEAAGHWLNNLPDGPVKDAAAQACALQAVKEDPDAALRWANAITDATTRDRIRRRVFTAWHDANPAAAAAWLPQSGWSESQIAAARDIMAAAPRAASRAFE